MLSKWILRGLFTAYFSYYGLASIVTLHFEGHFGRRWQFPPSFGLPAVGIGVLLLLFAWTPWIWMGLDKWQALGRVDEE